MTEEIEDSVIWRADYLDLDYKNLFHKMLQYLLNVTAFRNRETL